MTKNEIIDTAFNAQVKLELIKTVIETLIETVEKYGEISTPEQAMYFAHEQNAIDDFLHIAHDGVYFAIQTLDGLQKGGAE